MTSPEPPPRPRSRRVAPLLVVLLLVTSGCAGGGGSPELAVSDAVVALPVATSTAAYFRIENRGGADDVLTGVRTAAGRVAELHEIAAEESGLAVMRQVAAVRIPAGEVVVFAPAGFHVMIHEVDKLEEGATVSLELVFERSGAIGVEAEVRPYAAVLEG